MGARIKGLKREERMMKMMRRRRKMEDLCKRISVVKIPKLLIEIRIILVK